MVLAFAIGSVGGFLLFDWPPLLREVVLAYLLVFLIVRLVLVLGRILFAPGAERFRVIPMATATARFWFVWSTILVGWFAFVRITLDVLAAARRQPAGGLSDRAPVWRGAGRAQPVRRVAASGPARAGERTAAVIGSAPGCSRSTSSSSGCCCSPDRRRPSTSASPCCCCRSRSGAPIWRSSTCCARRTAKLPTPPSPR